MSRLYVASNMTKCPLTRGIRLQEMSDYWQRFDCKVKIAMIYNLFQTRQQNIHYFRQKWSKTIPHNYLLPRWLKPYPLLAHVIIPVTTFSGALTEMSFRIILNQLAFINCSYPKLSFHCRDQWRSLEQGSCEHFYRLQKETSSLSILQVK